MKKVININFQGRILPIEEVAYENLKQYIESLRTYFEQEEGKDEIINDIECRVAELCEDRLKKDAVCITEEDINLIVASIGRPADFEAQDGFEANTSHHSSAGGSFTNSTENTSTGVKRLYRDEQNKVLGGVCAGIANYLQLDPLLVRILWILLFGISFLAYLLLWIAVPSSSVKEVGGIRKRLFRDIDHKVIGGVCAGLSKYFGVKVIIIRLLFLIPSIAVTFNWNHFHLFQFWDFDDFPNFIGMTFFGPGALFIYIVLWLVLPEARTSADKLEMIGEKVDINSIKNTIQTDMEGFGKRAQAWGSSFDKKQTSNVTDANNHTMSQNKGCMYYFGRTFTILLKAFVYFILGIITISILAALFGIGVATTSLLPLKKFILEDGLQTWAFIGSILFFIWVPVVAIVASIVRKLAGYKKANIWVRSSFIALWTLGWICLFYFGSSLGHSFSKHNQPEEEQVQLSNAKLDYLELTATPKMKYYEDKWFQITPFNNYGDEDTLFVRNLRVRIVQSKTDSFEIKVVKLSNGKTVQEANTLANNINFNLTQQDSVLYLDRGIGISTKNKFRNQHIIMTIAVPVGKRFLISNKGWSQTNVSIGGRGMRSETIDRITDDNDWYDEWNEPWDSESFSYEQGVEYKMTTAGLEKIRRVNGKEDEEEEDDKDADEIEQKLQKLKEERLQLEQDLEKSKSEKVEKAAEERKDKKVAAPVKGELSTVKSVASKFADIQWVLDRFSY